MINIDKTLDELCALIEELEEKKQLDNLDDLLASNNEVQSLINDFEKAKERYYEVSKYSSHHPDFKEVSHQLIDAKEKMFDHELIKRYKEVENKLSIMTLRLNKQLKDIIPGEKKTCH